LAWGSRVSVALIGALISIGLGVIDAWLRFLVVRILGWTRSYGRDARGVALSGKF
jgi:hypothetical protein